MSISTWKKEFYPVDAHMPAASRTILTALRHSLRKWEGLRSFNLTRHHLHLSADYYSLLDWDSNSEFDVDSSTCALCCCCERLAKNDDKCGVCPLTLLRGVPCDATKDGRPLYFDYNDTPYGQLGDKGPGAMIRLIKRAIAKRTKAGTKATGRKRTR